MSRCEGQCLKKSHAGRDAAEGVKCRRRCNVEEAVYVPEDCPNRLLSSSEGSGSGKKSEENHISSGRGCDKKKSTLQLMKAVWAGRLHLQHELALERRIKPAAIDYVRTPLPRPAARRATPQGQFLDCQDEITSDLLPYPVCRSTKLQGAGSCRA